MAVTIHERFDSRETTVGESPSVALRYVVRGTDEDAVVKALVAATAPQTYADLKRDSFTVRPLGGGVWDCEVQYVRDESEQNAPQFSFDTGGGTEHITISLETVHRYAAPGEEASDYKGAIGVSDRVEGVDIVVPVFQFTETHYFASGAITNAYIATVFRLTGRVNQSAFRGFAKGEVLFLGASGSKRGDEDWELTFRFAASPNADDLKLGEIENIQKEGWHYLWAQFADDVDNNTNTRIKRPVAVYVERVYEYGDFSGLGIGT